MQTRIKSMAMFFHYAVILLSIQSIHCQTESIPGNVFSLDVQNREATTLSRIIDPSFLSLSFDPAFWVEFWGNASQPNEFSMRLLSNIAKRTGSYPIIRPGGVTQDSSLFLPLAGDPTRTVSENGTIYRTTYGPAFYRSFSNFPEGTKFTVPLNFGNDSLEIALDQAEAAVEYMRGYEERIFAFELGNEAGNYKATQRNLTTWGPAAYVEEWKNWTNKINDALPASLRHRWWAGSDGITPNPITVALQTEDLIARGINEPPKIREFSQHMYAYSSCKPASNAVATVPNIHNHTNITAFVSLLSTKVEAAQNIGTDLVIGEFNSVSCSGKANVTDIFGQALWIIDTSLFAATLNVSRVHLHQGATLLSQSSDQLNTGGYSAYDLWYPTDSKERGKRRVMPGYYSQLFMAEAIGHGSQRSRIVSVDVPNAIDPDKFAAYAFFDSPSGLSASPPKSRLPNRLVIINWNVFNGTLASSNDADDGSITLAVPRERGRQASLKRLTAPSHLTTSSAEVTWAGQSWEEGVPRGDEKVERVKDGRVKVRGSEAVLIFL